jgi:hypothetical protein
MQIFGKKTQNFFPYHPVAFYGHSPGEFDTSGEITDNNSNIHFPSKWVVRMIRAWNGPGSCAVLGVGIRGAKLQALLSDLVIKVLAICTILYWPSLIV